jgi:hypothetical protein
VYDPTPGQFLNFGKKKPVPCVQQAHGQGTIATCQIKAPAQSVRSEAESVLYRVVGPLGITRESPLGDGHLPVRIFAPGHIALRIAVTILSRWYSGSLAQRAHSGARITLLGSPRSGRTSVNTASPTGWSHRKQGVPVVQSDVKNLIASGSPSLAR